MKAIGFAAYFLVLFSISASCQSYPVYVPSDGLVAYDSFESIDLSLDFAPTQGTYTAVEDRFGNMSAAEFDGEALIFESTSTAVPNTSFTFSFWSHLDGGEVLSTAIHPVWGQTFGSGDSNAGTGIWMDSENIKVVEHSADYLRKAIEFGHDFTGWHHLVVTYQFNEVSLFVDGQLVANNSHDGRTIHAPLGRDDYYNYVNFGLGMGYGSTIWESEWEQNTFQGALDEFAVWNRVLTPEEILGMFDGEINGCTDAMACNYNPLANLDDSTCDYCFCLDGTQWVDSLQGCIVTEAALMQACGEGTYWDDLAQACLAIDTCPEDLDGDGVIGVNDLLDLLSSFGTECDLGSEVAEWTCGDLVNYHGYDYATVQIGEQCWFAENLRYLPNVNPVSAGSEDGLGTYCYVYGYDGNDVDEAASTENYLNYGALYNFHAFTEQNLCPANFHVPSQEEWDELIQFTGGAEFSGFQLKASGADVPSWNGINAYGFSALPSGIRRSNVGGENDWFELGTSTTFWTSTIDIYPSQARGKSLHNNFDWIQDWGHDIDNGLPVRCLQDSE